MKNLVLLALLMSTVLSASAQWVTIPDENFASKLNQFFPTCMEGNQLNTNCAEVMNASYLDVSYSNISDLDGVQYFLSLENLNCSGNPFISLPALPNSLKVLLCGDNDFNSVPELPDNLEELIISGNNLSTINNLPDGLTVLVLDHNNLTVLPELPVTLEILFCDHNVLSSLPELPNSLENLHCSNNNLTGLPELPESLFQLECSNMNLTTLPALPGNLNWLGCFNNDLIDLPEIPSSLSLLYCYNNNLGSIPELPFNLTVLSCGGNNLTSLPDLPASLEHLICPNNNLTSLPLLPSALSELNCNFNDLSEIPDLPESLVEFYCKNNALAELTDLPESLLKFECSSNNLTALPALPTLWTLKCDSNQLTCLPPLPMSLDYGPSLNLSGNPFTCLPNYVPAMSGENEEWLSFPLCFLGDTDNNPFGCNSFSGIAGTVYEDGNGNCEENSSESGMLNATIKLLDQDNGLVGSTYTFGSSDNILYNLVADTGNHVVQLVTDNMPFQVSCDDPGETQAVTLTEVEPSALNVDFGVECFPNHDLGTQSVTTAGWVFPGQQHTLNILAGDLSSWYGLQCAAGVSGSVTVNITGPVSFIEPSENALVPNVSGDIQLTYDIADFGNVDFEESFAVILETDTTAQAGDLVCVEVIVDPIEGDANPENNIYTHCYEVVNSYDPNIKQVWPQNVEPGYDGYFNYTIYFQNTGTAPAFNIRVGDTLDTNLDLSTFQVTGYSHECLTYVEGNVATFRFNDIMLPDSTSDFEESIGYVQYRIKAVEDLPVGTIIENTAHIFFDFNDAIVTNTTQNEYVITTSANQPQQQLATVFPNPGTGQFNVLFRGLENGLTTQLEVYNLNGQRVLQRQVNENRVMLDLTDYPSGMYLLHVRNERGSEAVKLMKH